MNIKIYAKFNLLLIYQLQVLIEIKKFALSGAEN